MAAGSSPGQPVLQGPARKEEGKQGTSCSVLLAVSQLPQQVLGLQLQHSQLESGTLAGAEVKRIDQEFNVSQAVMSHPFDRSIQEAEAEAEAGRV